MAAGRIDDLLGQLEKVQAKLSNLDSGEGGVSSNVQALNERVNAIKQKHQQRASMRNGLIAQGEPKQKKEYGEPADTAMDISQSAGSKRKESDAKEMDGSGGGEGLLRPRSRTRSRSRAGRRRPGSGAKHKTHHRRPSKSLPPPQSFSGRGLDNENATGMYLPSLAAVGKDDDYRLPRPVSPQGGNANHQVIITTKIRDREDGATRSPRSQPKQAHGNQPGGLMHSLMLQMQGLVAKQAAGEPVDPAVLQGLMAQIQELTVPNNNGNGGARKGVAHAPDATQGWVGDLASGSPPSLLGVQTGGPAAAGHGRYQRQRSRSTGTAPAMTAAPLVAPPTSAGRRRRESSRSGSKARLAPLEGGGPQLKGAPKGRKDGSPRPKVRSGSVPSESNTGRRANGPSPASPPEKVSNLVGKGGLKPKAPSAPASRRSSGVGGGASRTQRLASKQGSKQGGSPQAGDAGTGGAPLTVKVGGGLAAGGSRSSGEEALVHPEEALAVPGTPFIKEKMSAKLSSPEAKKRALKNLQLFFMTRHTRVCARAWRQWRLHAGLPLLPARPQAKVRSAVAAALSPREAAPAAAGVAGAAGAAAGGVGRALAAAQARAGQLVQQLSHKRGLLDLGGGGGGQGGQQLKEGSARFAHVAQDAMNAMHADKNVWGNI